MKQISRPGLLLCGLDVQIAALEHADKTAGQEENRADAAGRAHEDEPQRGGAGTSLVSIITLRNRRILQLADYHELQLEEISLLVHF